MTTPLERQFRKQNFVQTRRNISIFGQVSEEAKVASISSRNEPESGTFLEQIDSRIWNGNKEEVLTFSTVQSSVHFGRCNVASSFYFKTILVQFSLSVVNIYVWNLLLAFRLRHVFINDTFITWKNENKWFRVQKAITKMARHWRVQRNRKNDQLKCKNNWRKWTERAEKKRIDTGDQRKTRRRNSVFLIWIRNVVHFPGHWTEHSVMVVVVAGWTDSDQLQTPPQFDE